MRLLTREAGVCAEAGREKSVLVPVPTPHTRLPARDLADSALSSCTSYGDYQSTLPIIGAFMQCRPSNIDHMAWRSPVARPETKNLSCDDITLASFLFSASPYIQALHAYSTDETRTGLSCVSPDSSGGHGADGY